MSKDTNLICDGLIVALASQLVNQGVRPTNRQHAERLLDPKLPQFINDMTADVYRRRRQLGVVDILSQFADHGKARQSAVRSALRHIARAMLPTPARA